MAFGKISSFAEVLMKDIIAHSLSQSSSVGCPIWQLEGDMFDAQPLAQSLPRNLISAMELLLASCCCSDALSDHNKAVLLAMLAGACAQRMEAFISEVLLDRNSLLNVI
jgi:hypothetical protein